MKITKFPQSCILIEKEGKKLLIDPGSFVAQSYQPDQLGKIDVIIITHEHFDHADAALITELKEINPELKVYANEAVATALKGIVTNVASPGDLVNDSNFEIKVLDVSHVDLPTGEPGPQNNGYLIDDTFFHPGDGVTSGGATAKVAAVPIAGPDVSPRDAFDLAKSLNCEVMIPIHYDYFIADPHMLKNIAKQRGLPFEMRILENGQTADF